MRIAGRGTVLDLKARDKFPHIFMDRRRDIQGHLTRELPADEAKDDETLHNDTTFDQSLKTTTNGL